MGTIKQRRIEKRLLVLEDSSAISSLHRRYFYITSTPFRRSKSVEIPNLQRTYGGGAIGVVIAKRIMGADGQTEGRGTIIGEGSAKK